MRITNNSNVQTTAKTNTQKGKRAGTIIGAGAGSAYLVKNAKDTFVTGTKEAAEKLGNKKIGGAIAVAALALAFTAFTAAGRAIGGLIGRIKDNHDETKRIKLENEVLKDIIAAGKSSGAESVHVSCGKE